MKKNSIEIGKYVACICEGASEEAIMEILLDNNALIFDSSSLLDGELIRTRNARSFEQIYLRKQFDSKITIMRILDSRSEIFRLSKAYVEKIDVINVITAPEIEILIILKEGKFKEYKASGKKPSEFCKIELKLSTVKSKKFIESYFENVTDLLNAIKEYSRIFSSKPNELSLHDLLKDDFK